MLVSFFFHIDWQNHVWKMNSIEEMYYKALTSTGTTFLNCKSATDRLSLKNFLNDLQTQNLKTH